MKQKLTKKSNPLFIREWKAIIAKIFFLLFTIIPVTNTVAQTTWYEYFVAFTENGPFRSTYQPANVNYEIKVINPNSVAVYVVAGGGAGLTATINAGATHIFKFSASQVTAAFEELPATAPGPGYGDQTSSKGVTVSARDYPVTVCAMTQVPHSTDVTNLIWSQALGTEYYCINYRAAQTAVEFGTPNYTPKSGYMIIAAENGGTDVFENGTKRATLAYKGNVYYRYAYYGDMTGTHITTSRPAACIVMSTVAQVPSGSYHGDVLFQQLPPVNQWGRKFVVPLVATQNRIRVVATKNGTNITVDGATLDWAVGSQSSLTGLNAGEFVELSVSNVNGCYIEANQPVGVCSFLTGDLLNGGGSTAGDPAQAWVPPLEQMDRDVRVSAFQPDGTAGGGTYLNSAQHYALIIVPTATRTQTTGHSGLSSVIWRDVPGSDYSFCRINLGSHITSPATYSIDNPGGVIVGGYGLGQEESYYYYSGFGTNDLTVGFTVNDEDYLDMDGKVYCNTSDFVFKTIYNTLPASIAWTLNGTEIPGSANQTIVNVNNLPDGYYTISMTVPSGTLTSHFYAGKGNLIWTPEENTAGTDTQKQDWHNTANWTPAIVPSACFNVYIPGNCMHYPQMASAGECNNIYFMQGGELGRPDRLVYNEAYIHLNLDLKQFAQEKETNVQALRNLILEGGGTAERLKFSASTSQPLERERWYALSSPLRSVVSGDLSFGGFPLTFMKRFGPITKDNVTYPVGEWTTPYNSVMETFPSTVGFGFYAYGYGNVTGDNVGCLESGSFHDFNDLSYFPDRSGRTYGIRKTNGILELPFFADSLNVYAHRTQGYNGMSGESQIFYISDGSNGAIYTITGISDMIQRENNKGNYRFMPEEYNAGNWQFQNPVYYPVNGLSNGDEFLAGNPYMSSIDMVEFCIDNASSVDPEFHIWSGNTFDSYSVNTVTGVVTPTVPGNSRYVAPLQGFFLTYKGGDVRFDVTKISTVRPVGSASNLRGTVESSEKNILRIKAENELAASYMLIGYREGASNGFMRGRDVQKLFSFYDYVPEVYSLAGEIPADMNFIDHTVETLIPLGIKTRQMGNITLTFTGMDHYDQVSGIVLMDMLLNKEVDMSGLSSFVYSFDNQVDGILNDRFFIRFTPVNSLLPSWEQDTYIHIYPSSSGILVHSPTFDPIRLIQVYDVQGRKLYEEMFPGISTCLIPGNSEVSCVIVRVKTNEQVKSKKIVFQPNKIR